MERKAARPPILQENGHRELPIMGGRFSQRVKPRQYLRILFPPRGLRGFGRWIDLLECFSFCFEIGSCVEVGRVQSSMSKPISDNSHIDACGNQLDADAMPKRVRTHAFSRERWYLLGGCLNILPEFKSHTRRTERLA